MHPKRNISEVLIPSKRLIRDFVHRLDAHVSPRSLIPAKSPPLEPVRDGCFSAAWIQSPLMAVRGHHSLGVPI